MNTSPASPLAWKNVPTRTVSAGGVQFAYRELCSQVARVTCLDMLRGWLDASEPAVAMALGRVSCHELPVAPMQGARGAGARTTAGAGTSH